METMKYYTFYRESNNFDDLLSDPIIKKIADTKIQWTNYLMIGIELFKNDQNFSYITLKYGDDMINSVSKDFTPIPGIDYNPKKDKNKFVTNIT
jgi:hypothetical protein